MQSMEIMNIWRCSSKMLSTETLSKQLPKMNLESRSPKHHVDFFLSLDNVSFTLMINKSNGIIESMLALQTFGQEDAYLCLVGTLNSSDPFLHLDEYEFVFVKAPLSTTAGSCEGFVFPLELIPLMPRDAHCEVFEYSYRPGVQLEILFDLLVKLACGGCNEKQSIGHNITIDIPFVSPNLTLYREQLGFCVGHPQRFVQIEITAGEILRRLSSIPNGPTEDGAEIVAFDEEMLSSLIAFDCKVSGFRRVVFVRSVLADANNKAFVAKSGYSYFGYTIFSAAENRIFCLYGCSDEIKISLLKKVCEFIGDSSLKLCLYVPEFSFLQELGTVMMTIRRLHTICVPDKINWAMVAAVNCGMHVV